MELGSIFLIFAVVVVVSLFISRPFFTAASPVDTMSDPVIGKDDQAHSALLAERDRLLDSIQELDFDHALGKVPEEEYPNQRMALLQAGAEVLRKLDTLEGAHGSDTMDVQMEAAVAARRTETRTDLSTVEQPSKPSMSDEVFEQLVASRRKANQERLAGFCPHCGKPVRKDDLFCARCGTKLAE